VSPISGLPVDCYETRHINKVVHFIHFQAFGLVTHRQNIHGCKNDMLDRQFYLPVSESLDSFNMWNVVDVCVRVCVSPQSGKLVMKMFQKIQDLIDDKDALVCVLIDEVQCNEFNTTLFEIKLGLRKKDLFST